MKKYMDIERLKDKYIDVFTIGENIVIEEKVDGANASFTTFVDADGNCTVKAFSRNTELSEDKPLRGFYEWAQQIPATRLNEITEYGRYIIFGEWLAPHTIKYPDNRYYKFYMFDVWDCDTEQYISIEDANAMYKALQRVCGCTHINFVPVLDVCKFTGWDDVSRFCGVTHLDAEPTGEGIVIKSQDRLGLPTNSDRPIYVKIVTEKFAETKAHKAKAPKDPDVAAKELADKELAATIITERRVSKIIEKMIDAGQLREDWDEHDLGIIAKTAPKLVYDDCIKEESETVGKVDNFSKICSRSVMSIIKSMIK